MNPREMERLNDTNMDPLVIADDAGNVIFRLKGDGTAVAPDPAKLKLAAAIFWREVLHMARVMEIPVAFLGHEEPEQVQAG